VSDLEAVRGRYAEAVCAAAGAGDPALVRAFGTVARERFLGPRPWSIFTFDRGYVRTPDDDPIHLYRDVLVGIDPERRLNNGQPSSHALWMNALGVRTGERVVHVGCGTGYYTALLAELAGPSGRVTAIEIDPELARRAAANLGAWPQVTVAHADACAYDAGDADAIYVNGGASAPLPLWLDRLRRGGRMVLPLVRWPVDAREADRAGQGVMLRIASERASENLVARIVSLVWIFPCLGAASADGERAVRRALERGVEVGREYQVRRDAHGEEASCWLHGETCCLAERGTDSAVPL